MGILVYMYTVFNDIVFSSTCSHCVGMTKAVLNAWFTLDEDNEFRCRKCAFTPVNQYDAKAALERYTLLSLCRPTCIRSKIY